MLMDTKKSIARMQCEVHCPIGAITIGDEYAKVDFDECTERSDRTFASQDILEINTLCGRGMVAVKLIEDTAAAEIKRGKITPMQGTERFSGRACTGFSTWTGRPNCSRHMAGK